MRGLALATALLVLVLLPLNAKAGEAGETVALITQIHESLRLERAAFQTAHELAKAAVWFDSVLSDTHLADEAIANARATLARLEPALNELREQQIQAVPKLTDQPPIFQDPPEWARYRTLFIQDVLSEAARLTDLIQATVELDLYGIQTSRMEGAGDLLDIVDAMIAGLYALRDAYPNTHVDHAFLTNDLIQLEAIRPSYEFALMESEEEYLSLVARYPGVLREAVQRSETQMRDADRAIAAYVKDLRSPLAPLLGDELDARLDLIAAALRASYRLRGEFHTLRRAEADLYERIDTLEFSPSLTRRFEQHYERLYELGLRDFDTLMERYRLMLPSEEIR